MVLVDHRHRIMLSRWANSVTKRREVSSQISSLRQPRILDNSGVVDAEELNGLLQNRQVLRNELDMVNSQVGEGRVREK